MDPVTDHDLLARVRAGDSTAFGQLYRRHEPAAQATARCLTRSADEANDVVADAFAKVLAALRGGAGPTEAFRAYLLTTVRRTAWRRQERCREQPLARGAPLEVADPDGADGGDPVEEARVRAAFQALPERWQRILWDTAVEGQRPADVATLLGLSPNAHLAACAGCRLERDALLELSEEVDARRRSLVRAA